MFKKYFCLIVISVSLFVFSCNGSASKSTEEPIVQARVANHGNSDSSVTIGTTSFGMLEINTTTDYKEIGEGKHSVKVDGEEITSFNITGANAKYILSLLSNGYMLKVEELDFNIPGL
jgi:hypothetical protein